MDSFRTHWHAPDTVNHHQPRITGDQGLRPRHGGKRFLAAPLVARVQNHLESLFDEELTGHSAEPVRRASKEHPRYDLSLLSVRMQRRPFTIQAPIASGELIGITIFPSFPTLIPGRCPADILTVGDCTCFISDVR